jgi:hypothetical protein
VCIRQERGDVSKCFTGLLVTLIIAVPVYCTHEHYELTPINTQHNIQYCIVYPTPVNKFLTRHMCSCKQRSPIQGLKLSKGMPLLFEAFITSFIVASSGWADRNPK